MEEEPGEKKPVQRRELPIVPDETEDTEQAMREIKLDSELREYVQTQ